MAKIIIDHATKADIDELLRLYFSIYANTYPLKLGVDRGAMEKAINDLEHFYWPVMRDQETGVIAGTVIFELDLENKIGKITGLVVHKSYRNLGISGKLVAHGKKFILEEKGVVNSLYATTRTFSATPQLIFLKNGFFPLGIFPNAHKLKQYETLTLFAAFKEGVLEKREKIAKIPKQIIPIVQVMSDIIGDAIPLQGIEGPGTFCSFPRGSEEMEKDFTIFNEEEEFEFIFAPHFVARRFKERFQQEEGSGYYPFHTPNLLITSTKNDDEVYACFNQRDHYCVIIATNKTPAQIKMSYKNLIYFMKDHGISYIEVLLPMNQTESINFYSRNDFLPSAIYPAMREIDGKMQDYIIFTRTMEPLDFKGININKAFGPFVDQYVQQWFNMHIKTLEVDNA